VAPLTTTVLTSVSSADAGVASGVNNTAARVGGLLAIAIIGVLAFALYRGALERRLAAAGVPVEATHAIVAERRGFADVTIPASVAGAERTVVASAVNAAFLDGFRVSVLLCAVICLAGAAIAVVMLDATASEAHEDATAPPACIHVGVITASEPRTQGCEECLRIGSTWVHLRQCLSCGHVGCCDGSKNRHAARHFWSSQHPIVRSAEPEEDWRWCYVDETTV
jgi:hypothetical protein